ncbi:MAG: amidohydrolase family protein [Candidatus Baltobacteraceae bacterium]
MVASGLSPRDVLLAATRGGAEMMGRAGDLGTIEPGKLADLVVLRANPLEDVRAIAAVDRVVKDGHLFVASAIVSEGPERVVQRQVNAYNHHDAEVFGEAYALDATVVDRERVTGYADGRSLEATVTYHVRAGSIVRAEARLAGS